MKHTTDSQKTLSSHYIQHNNIYFYFIPGRGAKYYGPRPTSVPSGMMINPAVWPKQIWAENWRGRLGPHLTQCGLDQLNAYLRTK